LGFSFLGLITLLLVYQLVGELIVLTVDWPIPGPVVGMFLLLITLLLRQAWSAYLIEPSQQFLRYLSLFFVPAGVGVMVHLTRIGEEWLPIVLALILSTIVSLVVTAAVMLGVARLMKRHASEVPHE